MRDWLLERFLARLSERGPGGGGRLPRWVRALLDETFLWVALGQLLLALGVRRSSVRRLAVVQATLDEAREVFGKAGYVIPRLEGIETDRDLERLEDAMSRFESREFTEEELSAILPAPHAVRWAREAGTVVLDLLEETLGRLRTLRIRTELIGIDHRAARSWIVALREVLARSDLDTAAAEGYAALAQSLETLEGEGLFAASELETRPRAPGLGEMGRLVGVIRSIPRETLDRLLPLRVLSSRVVLTAAITKGLKLLRQDWVPPGERPDPVEDAEVARHQDYQRRWRRAHSTFFREIDERDARPGARRALMGSTAILWALSLVVLGWLLLWFLGAGGVDLPGILGRSAELPPLWPGPTVLVLIAVLPLSYWTGWLAPIDQSELVQPGMRTVADATPARRTRVTAARFGSVISSLLFFLPFLVALLIDPKDTFPWDAFGPWRNEKLDVGWWAVWALALPAAATILGGIAGSVRGEARARTLRPKLG
ncbi:MAG: hypothetical protein ACTMII_00005 [Brachybacterium sp.]